VRVRVNQRVCVGSLLCQQLCPGVFQVIGNVSTVRVDPVPPELQDACREAAARCPSGAITIEDRSGPPAPGQAGT
jgi:ferredoxin